MPKLKITTRNENMLTGMPSTEREAGKMPGNFRKVDLRVHKTRNAIHEALLKLLGRRSFARITVNALCEEAQISRRTFYMHFNDKYDLLKFHMTNNCVKIKQGTNGENSCAQIETTINLLIREYEKEISNLVKDADNETLNLLYAGMLSILDVPEEKEEDGKLSPRYIVFSNFCTGGMMKLLSWQVENKFPQELQWVNANSISLIKHLLAWVPGSDYIDGGKPPYDMFPR